MRSGGWPPRAGGGGARADGGRRRQRAALLRGTSTADRLRFATSRSGFFSPAADADDADELQATARRSLAMPAHAFLPEGGAAPWRPLRRRSLAGSSLLALERLLASRETAAAAMAELQLLPAAVADLLLAHLHRFGWGTGWGRRRRRRRVPTGQSDAAAFAGATG